MLHRKYHLVAPEASHFIIYRTRVPDTNQPSDMKLDVDEVGKKGWRGWRRGLTRGVHCICIQHNEGSLDGAIEMAGN